MSRKMDGRMWRQKIGRFKIFFSIDEICIKVQLVCMWPIGTTAAICEVLGAIQCFCQAASHSPALLSSAYTQSIPQLQYHFTSDGHSTSVSLSISLFNASFYHAGGKD